MPIRPENLARYGADWPAFSRDLRARFPVCQWCGKPNGARVYATRSGSWALASDDPSAVILGPHVLRWWSVTGAPCPPPAGWEHVRALRVVLTVAHLNHAPEDRSPENLRVLCQRCHNRHDAQHRARNRATTWSRKRREGSPQLSLSAVDEVQL